MCARHRGEKSTMMGWWFVDRTSTALFSKTPMRGRHWIALHPECTSCPTPFRVRLIDFETSSASSIAVMDAIVSIRTYGSRHQTVRPRTMRATGTVVANARPHDMRQAKRRPHASNQHAEVWFLVVRGHDLKY